MSKKTYAVVDFGTNSARLMIANVEDNHIISVTKQLKTIRLGDNMAEGRLTDTSMIRASQSLSAFIRAANHAGTKKLYAFATSAVREAENASDFVRHIKATCGVDVDVISGDTEADIGYLGAAIGKPGRIGLIDIGGGSTEIVVGENGHIEYAQSFKVGTVRLLQMFCQSFPGTRTDYADCQKHIQSIFTDLPKTLSADIWLGIGGTGTALAAVDQRLKIYDPSKVDGYALGQLRLDALASELQSLTLEEREHLTGLDEKRADVIVFGALLMQTFTKLVGSDGYTACESDNLEGYLLKKLHDSTVCY